MILAGTGHRPDKLGGYNKRTYKRLTDLAIAAIRFYKPSEIITGVALGWDTWLAIAAIEEKIPYTCAVPFKGQEKRWRHEDKQRYHCD